MVPEVSSFVGNPVNSQWFTSYIITWVESILQHLELEFPLSADYPEYPKIEIKFLYFSFQHSVTFSFIVKTLICRFERFVKK